MWKGGEGGSECEGGKQAKGIGRVRPRLRAFPTCRQAAGAMMPHIHHLRHTKRVTIPFTQPEAWDSDALQRAPQKCSFQWFKNPLTKPNTPNHAFALALGGARGLQRRGGRPEAGQREGAWLTPPTFVGGGSGSGFRIYGVWRSWCRLGVGASIPGLASRCTSTGVPADGFTSKGGPVGDFFSPRFRDRDLRTLNKRTQAQEAGPATHTP